MTDLEKKSGQSVDGNIVLEELAIYEYIPLAIFEWIFSLQIDEQIN